MWKEFIDNINEIAVYFGIRASVNGEIVRIQDARGKYTDYKVAGDLPTFEVPLIFLDSEGNKVGIYEQYNKACFSKQNGGNSFNVSLDQNKDGYVINARDIYSDYHGIGISIKKELRNFVIAAGDKEDRYFRIEVILDPTSTNDYLRIPTVSVETRSSKREKMREFGVDHIVYMSPCLEDEDDELTYDESKNCVEQTLGNKEINATIWNILGEIERIAPGSLEFLRKATNIDAKIGPVCENGYMDFLVRQLEFGRMDFSSGNQIQQ